MKKISIIWGLIVVLIFGGLTIIGILYKDIRPYDELKERMIEYTKYYVESVEDFSLKKGKSTRIELSFLKDNYNNVEFDVEKDDCDGYVEISKGLFGLKYKANIKCNNYPKKQ